MKLGIIGLPGSGKTTIFRALSGKSGLTLPGDESRPGANVASVEVMDPRVDRLAAMYRPRKVTRARFDVVDFPYIGRKEGDRQLLTPSELGLIRSIDALCIVIRNFRDPLMDSMYGEPRPRHDLDSLYSEILLSDLLVIENRLSSIEKTMARGKNPDDSRMERELLIRIKDNLEQGSDIGSLRLQEKEKRLISGYQFLCLKPAMVLLNSDETSFGNNGDLIAEMEKRFKVMELAGRFEMELSDLDTKDMNELMNDMGLDASALDRLTTLAYGVLGYISFFTVGEDEVRAWTIKRGTRALDAAGVIHSDIAKGFIRAECFSFSDLMAAGSEKELRKKGLIRLEGKDYTVKDGDILNIRFNV